MLKLITIQKVFAENRHLHSFLVSKGFNKQTTPFFSENDSLGNVSFLMLSPRGRIFRFCIEDGKYKSVCIENPSLLKQMLSITEHAVITDKYPFFKETLSVIRKNLSYIPKTRLF